MDYICLLINPAGNINPTSSFIQNDKYFSKNLLLQNLYPLYEIHFTPLVKTNNELADC